MFDLAVVDPPWLWTARSPKGEDRSPDYQRMSLDDLCDVPVSSILNANAVVCLWVIDPMLPQAMRVIEAWGLNYKTVGWYWVKHKPSGREHLGGGYYTRANPEQVWICTKGKGLPRISKGVRRVLHAPVREHSAKPDLFFDRVVELFGDVRRVDIFARRNRPGWICLGNEIDGMDIRDAIRVLATDKAAINIPVQ
ncbi:MAG: DNA methyltransferase [Actinobacteria bacterium]|nr:DNA methyltransferase [Actinomycetota bacterium]